MSFIYDDNDPGFKKKWFKLENKFQLFQKKLKQKWDKFLEECKIEEEKIKKTNEIRDKEKARLQLIEEFRQIESEANSIHVTIIEEYYFF